MTAFKKLTAYSDVKREWVSPTYPYDEENAQLQAENAKLRELLDYVTPIAWYAASERERDRMRELGVEV